MGFLEGLLTSLLMKILTALFNKAVVAAEKYYEQVKLDNERGETNAENVKKYEEAKDRAAKRKAAIDLLNGNRTP